MRRSTLFWKLYGSFAVTVLAAILPLDLALNGFLDRTLGPAYADSTSPDVTGLPPSPSEEPYSIHLARTAVPSVLALLAALGVGAVMARRTRNGFTSFARGAEAIARGDYDARLPVTSRDEVGQLAAVFNKMADSLRVTHDQLRREREAAEAAGRALRAEEERLRMAVQSIDEILFEFDTDARCVKLWAPDERLHGIPREAIVGRRPPEFVNGPGIESFMTAFEDVVRDFRPRQVEYALDLSDGRRWFLGRISPVRSADRACARLCVLALDITDRKRSEAALAESERFARSTVDALTDHIAIIDGAGEILAVNQAWREFAAANGLRTPHYGLGSNYIESSEAGGPEGAAAAAGIRDVLRGARERFDLEYPCHSPNEQRWFAMRVTRFSGAGSVRLVVCHENITERKRNESLRHEKDDLRSAVAAMEQVLGVVGHELRTPLAGLRAISELLLTDGVHGTAEATHFLTAMNEEVVRMGDTVDQILEAARLNSGRAKWNWAEFPLRRVCEDALATVRPLVDGSRVRIVCDVDPAGVTMRGDADAIRRLVLNLAGNARKHTRDGEIRVAVRADADADGDWIELRVSDTGAGIPPEIVARLGEAFALNSGIVGANHVSGTGLGLAICKGVAAAHGGRIEVASVLGHGTTVLARVRADLTGPTCGGEKNLMPRTAATAAAA
jgi:PAS domain S-box-containing protein